MSRQRTDPKTQDRSLHDGEIRWTTRSDPSRFRFILRRFPLQPDPPHFPTSVSHGSLPTDAPSSGGDTITHPIRGQEAEPAGRERFSSRFGQSEQWSRTLASLIPLVHRTSPLVWTCGFGASPDSDRLRARSSPLHLFGFLRQTFHHLPPTFFDGRDPSTLHHRQRYHI